MSRSIARRNGATRSPTSADEDQAIVICLRHAATQFAFSNEIWARYDILRKEKYTHPETGKTVKGGNVFRPGSTSPKSSDDAFTLDGLANAHFMASGILAAQRAGEYGYSIIKA